MNWKTCYAVLSGVLGLALASEASGAVQWYFNWYCSGCARIGARTTGTNGPFSSREACESARSSMQSTMNSRGGGVNTVACQSSGVDMPAPQPSTTAPPGGYRGGGYQAPQQQTQQPNFDYEQQRRAEEERRRKEEEARHAEAERQRREEFARSRDQALGLLKGGGGGELTIKGLDSGGELGLKTPDVGTLRDAPSPRSKSQAASKCSPNQDASVVDLCDRNATKPIDPRTVQGKPRIQVSEKTLANENYIKGFNALRAGDYPIAVSLFKKARAELGNDFFVKNALGLAEDLVKVRAKKKIILDPLTPGSATPGLLSGADHKAKIIFDPLTPGSATPGLLSGADHEKKFAEYEARKADVFRRMVKQTLLRNECRAKLPACSTDGKAYDQREALRRRDRQYFLWGEASYYIRFTDLLTPVPPEMEKAKEMGTLGGIKFLPHGGETVYIWYKRIVKEYGSEYGSTPPGGNGAARLGLLKAINDNQGVP